MPEYVIMVTSVAIVGGLILGAIYFIYNSIMSNMRELKSDITAVDAKVEQLRLELHAKIDNEIAGLRSEIGNEAAGLRSKIDNEATGLRSEISNEIAGLNSKINNEIAGLNSKINNEIAGLRSEMNAGFARLDAKIDSRTDNLRSDLGGRMDTNTEKLSELATEVQVHLRTHHLIGEIAYYDFAAAARRGSTGSRGSEPAFVLLN